jgi:hypothetical protein
LVAYADSTGLRFLSQFDLETLDKFRSMWKDGPRPAAKKLERVKAFFRFVTAQKWTTETPALELKSVKVSSLRKSWTDTRTSLEGRTTHFFSQAALHSDTVAPCEVLDKKCKTADEFDDLVRPYLNR